MSFPARVRIVEVGPRDGLQNQPEIIPAAQKLEWIRRLAAAGLEEIEVTAFVHPKWVPALADAEEVASAVPDTGVVLPSALVPNLRGLERAIEKGLRRFSLFTAASETFSKKNTNCSIDQSFDRFAEVFERLESLDEKAWVRGYISTCFGCPYEGDVSLARVVEVAKRLHELGVAEVAISDTTGVGFPKQVHKLVEAVAAEIPLEEIALHFHDTRGQALVNVYAGLESGVEVFDASAGGLGGCPYAPGAAGNLATEDLVKLLEALGIETGVDCDALAGANLWFESLFPTPFPSRVLATYRGVRDE